jgi:quaternary ammonium compound-resistance protein SugE
VNPWLMVVLAGILECVWALGLKYSDGFTRLWPSVITAVAVTGSFVLLSMAMRTLPIGTAYAVWVGIGAVGTAIAAVFLFQEPINATRIAGIGLVVAGIAALKLA